MNDSTPPGTKATAILQLRTLADECAAADWDGNGALPIESAAGRLAADFVRALPDSVPLPEFAVEPDGSLSLDWMQSRHRVFSLSVSTNNQLAYAWVDGADKGHGVARFDGKTIPPRVLKDLSAIMNEGRTVIAQHDQWS